MILSSLLSSSKYIIVNKDLIKELGLHEAVILGELCSEYSYWESTNQLKENGYFYSTRENIEKNTGINAHYQRVAIKTLEEKGILVTKRMGIPCKKYYKINEDKVIEYLKKAKIIVESSDVHEMNNKGNMSCTTNDLTDEQQDVDNMNINNNNINNKIINNKEYTHGIFQNDEKIKYAKLVTLTNEEYKDLVKTYGEESTSKLIEQLSLYKQAHGKSYDCDYAAIKIGVIERIKKLEKTSYKKMMNNKNINNLKLEYDQREYLPGFFDYLYAN